MSKYDLENLQKILDSEIEDVKLRQSTNAAKKITHLKIVKIHIKEAQDRYEEYLNL